jgi:hypothetical protein
MQKLVMGLMAASIVAVAAPTIVRAATPKAEARLATPVSEPRKVVVDGRAWMCAAETCTTIVEDSGQTLRRECTHLVKAVGPLLAYRSSGRQMTEADLAACNNSPRSTELSLKR